MTQYAKINSAHYEQWFRETQPHNYIKPPRVVEVIEYLGESGLATIQWGAGYNAIVPQRFLTPLATDDKYENMGLRELLEEMASLQRATLGKEDGSSKHPGRWCCEYDDWHDGQYFYADIPEQAIRHALRFFDNN